MRRWILKKEDERWMLPEQQVASEFKFPEIETMKPRFILSLSLAAGLLTPLLRAQDAPAKVREIEQKVLLEEHRKAVHSLVGTAREVGNGDRPHAPEILGKRIEWLAAVGRQLGADEKAAAAKRQDMAESAGTLNDLAWNMITSPDPAGRQPETALKLADIAIELGGEDWNLKPNALDTRARALFLLGKRDEAIAAQEQALAAATVAEEKAGFEKTLAAYRKGELPEGPSPEGERETFDTAEAALAAKDLRSRLDEIVGLQRRIGSAAKEGSGAGKGEVARMEAELTKRMAELAKLTEVKDPASQRRASAGATYLLGKLRGIVIPTVSFKDTTLEEAVDFLRKRSIELDANEIDPARKGVNFVVRLPAADPADKEGGKPEEFRIKALQLRNVPLSEALRYVCEATHLRYKVDDFAVTVFSPNAPEYLFNRTFRVPPDFGSSLVPIQELLKMCGVGFGEGASATLIAPDTLVTRNTSTELDKIEQLIEAVTHSRPAAAPAESNGR